ncbi:MlaD family protein [Actinacidiphila oryziradicis]|uniref:MCE family protein n=1 Tax=Actinacidiphila oryziradicis TaxID=2571141 RepID=A0A4U0S945_9ACTN|nr:MlaD family protein [Actinacidiphila oryziradicis]TKA01047.1 MCE family protein [Actinacidiphila oryziradicis]TKA04988.1 MCE family protein [Actinacidiphila oryziradicis]
MSFITSRLGKMLVLGVFTILALIYLGYLFGKAGVSTPFAGNTYKVSFTTPDVDNLIPIGDVDMAGVRVGKVDSVSHVNGTAKVLIKLDANVAPLHKGAGVQIGAKSLAGESYVGVTDGTGSALPSGTALPSSAVKPSVQLADVIRSLDPKTRTSLGSLARSLGTGTDGTKESVSQTMTGLGNIGNQGFTALDAISAQSKDLMTLAQQTTTILSALDEGEGQIGQLVKSAQQLTSATSGQQKNLSATVRSLPGVLSSTQTATQKLTTLSTSLAPVASDLNDAAPSLNTALQQLPQTTKDLRGLLPDLNGTLTEAPATLDRVPTLASDADAVIPQLETTLSNLNPMLGYLEPYGPELGSFFSNFGAMMKYSDEAGIHYFRLEPDLGNEQIVKGVPIKLPNILVNDNPYPAPGQSDAATGRSFTRLYPAKK